jgi:hypothetical protein
VVIGWWHSPEFDPIADRHSAMSVSRGLRGFAWSASAAPREPDLRIKQPRSEEFFKSDLFRHSAYGQPLEVSAALRASTSQAALFGGYARFSRPDAALKQRRFFYQTLMHGSAYGVPIRGKVSADRAPKPAAISLSMAPTLERAVAAQASTRLARIPGAPEKTLRRNEYFETLITALANGRLRDIGQPGGLVALDETEHRDGFESFQGPETYTEVIVEQSQDQLRAGRPKKSRLAAETSGKPPKADVMWTGRRPGGLSAGKDALRERARAESDKQHARAGLPARGKVQRLKRPAPPTTAPAPR